MMPGHEKNQSKRKTKGGEIGSEKKRGKRRERGREMNQRWYRRRGKCQLRME